MRGFRGKITIALIRMAMRTTEWGLTCDHLEDALEQEEGYKNDYK